MWQQIYIILFIGLLVKTRKKIKNAINFFQG